MNSVDRWLGHISSVQVTNRQIIPDQVTPGKLSALTADLVGDDGGGLLDLRAIREAVPLQLRR